MGRTTALPAVAGEPFSVSLDEPVSSGYRWEVEAADPGLELVSETFERPPGGEVGGTGVRRFTFRAREAGAYGLALRLRRPWEEDPRERRAYRVEAR